jgi:hypothetical protein
VPLPKESVIKVILSAFVALDILASLTDALCSSVKVKVLLVYFA